MIELDWTLPVASAVFLVTLFALNRLLFKPLFRVLDERRSRTSDLRERAQGILDSYQSRFEDYQGKVKEEKQLGYQLAESVRSEALRERQQKIFQTRTASQALLEEAKKQIHQELASAQAQLRREAEEVARTITARVLGRA